MRELVTNAINNQPKIENADTRSIMLQLYLESMNSYDLERLKIQHTQRAKKNEPDSVQMIDIIDKILDGRKAN